MNSRLRLNLDGTTGTKVCEPGNTYKWPGKFLNQPERGRITYQPLVNHQVPQSPCCPHKRTHGTPGSRYKFAIPQVWATLDTVSLAI